jgi:hypothetical protein
MGGRARRLSSRPWSRWSSSSVESERWPTPPRASPRRWRPPPAVTERRGHLGSGHHRSRRARRHRPGPPGPRARRRRGRAGGGRGGPRRGGGPSLNAIIHPRFAAAVAEADGRPSPTGPSRRAVRAEGPRRRCRGRAAARGHPVPARPRPRRRRRLRARGPVPSRGPGVHRADQHPGAGLGHHHRARELRADPQPLGHHPLSTGGSSAGRRLRRGGHRSHGPRRRRWRLDPDPRRPTAGWWA